MFSVLNRFSRIDNGPLVKKVFDKALLKLSEIVSSQFDPRSVPESEWPGIIKQAMEHSMGPILLWMVTQTDIKISDGVYWQPLIEESRKNAMHDMHLENAFLELAKAFAESGINAVWLKGTALSRTVYPDAALRPCADLDILVPFDQREASLDILKSKEYRFYDDPSQLLPMDHPIFLKLTHHFHLKGRPPASVFIDLHFRLLRDEELLSQKDHKWFMEQVQTETFNDQVFSILKPEAHLLFLIAHAVWHHEREQLYLIWYFDIHLLISKTELSWKMIVEKAIDLKWNRTAEKALKLCEELFATPVPSDVFSKLKDRRPPGEKIPRKFKFEDRGFGLEMMLQNFKHLETKEKVVLTFRTLFPPAKYMRYHYQVREGRLVLHYYLVRWFMQIHHSFSWVLKQIFHRKKNNKI